MSPELKIKTQTQTKVDLYDADAVQRMTFDVPQNGETYETVHIIQPLTDERYVAFEKKCPTKIVDDGNSITTERLESSAALWDELCTDIEGFDGDKPTDWQSRIDPVGEKQTAINLLTVAVIVEAENASTGGRSWNTANEIVLEAHFNYPGIISTKHFLRKKTIKDGKRFESLQKIPMSKGGKGLHGSSDVTLPSMVKAKAQIYDEMQEKPAEGYADNLVPIWHKTTVVDYIFRPAVSAKK